MSAISDFVAKQNAHNDRQDKALEGISGDIKAQAELIAKIQNSPGTLSPEDQKALDDLDARNEAVTGKLEALDAMTPPAPPADTGGTPNIPPV